MRHEPVSLRQKIVVGMMGFFILIPGMLGFAEKLYQFFHVLMNDDGGRFALIPIATYLLLSLGFLFLIVWGIFKGMLSDIEGPKYAMMEDEEKWNAEEGYQTV